MIASIPSLKSAGNPAVFYGSQAIKYENIDPKRPAAQSRESCCNPYKAFLAGR
jgi:hypothetical protein